MVKGEVERERDEKWGKVRKGRRELRQGRKVKMR